jgi:hypothetical protein
MTDNITLPRAVVEQQENITMAIRLIEKAQEIG